jgi:putative transposase
VKYRKTIFTNDAIADFLKMKTGEIVYTFDVDILDIECDKDHLNMIFKFTPLLNIPRFINAIKTITSREIQSKFPEVKK